MSESEKHALELRAQNDPFLYEAMEGYENNPEALGRIEKHIENQKKADKSFFGSRTLAVLGVISLIYLVTWIFYKPENEASEIVFNQEGQKKDTATFEVEIIPESIDTFKIVVAEEQIEVSEIVQAHSSIEQVKSNSSDSFLVYQDKITFDEDIELVEYFEIEEEFSENNIIVYAPSTYLEDLFVVDYREIKRKSNLINYTKYELTGVSAAFENDSVKKETELTERQVEVPYMEYLETSMYYFSKKKFKKSLNRYLTILEQYPKDLNALFYGGLCYYNVKKYSEALELFELAQVYETEKGFVAFRQESKWYLAKTLIKMKKINRAKRILDEIIIEGKFYSTEAIQLRKELQ